MPRNPYSWYNLTALYREIFHRRNSRAFVNHDSDNVEYRLETDTQWCGHLPFHAPYTLVGSPQDPEVKAVTRDELVKLLMTLDPDTMIFVNAYGYSSSMIERQDIARISEQKQDEYGKYAIIEVEE